ncbi:TetR/AcrR family transcriptional regulator [Halomarina ordinaria]|uniref:TetR/AcrR family transcriptional regulator n=1 Tax=Halomarina ordinaria TaxID=3033939 RepID=A0ABD5UAZ9_9EURY|nr:TetR/AcrR family transcriptional regulator [Halomarina sp. PSRA2]
MHGFSDEERVRIRERLLETGREMLLTYGPKKTNVADITEPVGIAKSTFYRFFDSKDELYLEVVQREFDQLTACIDEELADVEDPCEGLERLFGCYRDFAEGNPLVQRLLTRDDYRETFRNVPPETVERVQREALADIVPHVERLQARTDGPLARRDPVVVLMLMGTVGQMVLYREEYEEYGEGYYEEVQDLLVTSLARGLTAG